jgi:hypothetical protein
VSTMEYHPWQARVAGSRPYPWEALARPSTQIKGPKADPGSGRAQSDGEVGSKLELVGNHPLGCSDG